MRFRERLTAAVYNHQALQEIFPNIFIPQEPSDEFLNNLGDGYDPVLMVSGASLVFDRTLNKAELAGIELVEGRWQDKWDIIPFSPQEAAYRLLQAKISKNEEINASRLEANYATFTHNGKSIACDLLSRSDIDATNGIIGLYNVMPNGWPGGWKTTDNSYVVISTIADWKSFYSSMFAAGSINFAYAQQLKAQLAAATTLTEIEAIKW